MTSAEIDLSAFVQLCQRQKNRLGYGFGSNFAFHPASTQLHVALQRPYTIASSSKEDSNRQPDSDTMPCFFWEHVPIQRSCTWPGSPCVSALSKRKARACRLLSRLVRSGSHMRIAGVSKSESLGSGLHLPVVNDKSSFTRALA